MSDVIPFKPTDAFTRMGIEWTRSATTVRERRIREAFLTLESSSGMRGLAAVLLLAAACRRRGTVAIDLQNAADFAEIILSAELRKHMDDTLAGAQAYAKAGGPAWS